MMMTKGNGGGDWRKRIPRRVNFADILPNEILVHIVRDCNSKDIGRISHVCRSLNEFIKDYFVSYQCTLIFLLDWIWLILPKFV